MCWNQYVSLNTFIFSVFVLLLIAFNNKYSNYKLNEFKSIYVYFFIMSFALMQFIEFILWRNLNNQLINKIMSLSGALLLVVQPIVSLTMLNNINLRNKLLFIYSIISSIFFLYQLINHTFNTTVSKFGQNLVENLVSLYIYSIYFFSISLYSIIKTIFQLY